MTDIPLLDIARMALLLVVSYIEKGHAGAVYLAAAVTPSLGLEGYESGLILLLYSVFVVVVWHGVSGKFGTGKNILTVFGALTALLLLVAFIVLQNGWMSLPEIVSTTTTFDTTTTTTLFLINETLNQSVSTTLQAT